jgi:hypothetical protein
VPHPVDTNSLAYIKIRKLGKEQSLVFCVSEEIRAKILKFTKKVNNTVLKVSDVLSWDISEIFLELQWSLPL